jgi:GNAT superfamily N-acetyltransferase
MLFTIDRATRRDSREVAAMAGELLAEITVAIGEQAFNFDLEATTARLENYLDQEKYIVFVARTARLEAAGFIAICETYALYAEGALGTIPELFVRSPSRGNQLGLHLLSQAKSLGAARGWTRLEVTTPPLPAFARTLAFYEREGFSISGGRKLKHRL